MLSFIFFSLIIIFIIPKKYCVLEDKIKIIFRGPLEFNIPFSTIIIVRPTRWSTVGINLPTNLSVANALEIIRRKRMAVTITPVDKDKFIDNFEKAFHNWKAYNTIII